MTSFAALVIFNAPADSLESWNARPVPYTHGSQLVSKFGAMQVMGSGMINGLLAGIHYRCTRSPIMCADAVERSARQLGNNIRTPCDKAAQQWQEPLRMPTSLSPSY